MPRRPAPASVLLPRWLALLGWLLPAPASALCTSEGVAQPQALLERFVDAGCAECWRDPATPAGGPGVLALDWIVPGAAGDDAPLAAAQSLDAPDRLRALGRPAPARSLAVTTRRAGPGLSLRIAQGPPVADYLAFNLDFQPPPGSGRWDAWLVLVESLPAGAEGSPVARNLVRNVFRPEWPATAPPPWTERRSMQIHDGVDVRRLRLVALARDARGHMRAITRTECPPGWPQ